MFPDFATLYATKTIYSSLKIVKCMFLFSFLPAKNLFVNTCGVHTHSRVDIGYINWLYCWKKKENAVFMVMKPGVYFYDKLNVILVFQYTLPTI